MVYTESTSPLSRSWYKYVPLFLGRFWLEEILIVDFVWLCNVVFLLNYKSPPGHFPELSLSFSTAFRGKRTSELSHDGEVEQGVFCGPPQAARLQLPDSQAHAQAIWHHHFFKSWFVWELSRLTPLSQQRKEYWLNTSEESPIGWRTHHVSSASAAAASFSCFRHRSCE